MRGAAGSGGTIVTLGYCVQHASLLLLLLLLLVFTRLMLLTLASSARALVHTMANFSLNSVMPLKVQFNQSPSGCWCSFYSCLQTMANFS